MKLVMNDEVSGMGQGGLCSLLTMMTSLTLDSGTAAELYVWTRR